MSYFVGNKQSPSFLVEITKSKQVNIYQPDSLSKKEPDFYEKYALGKATTMKYSDIVFLKSPSSFKGMKYVPGLIIKGAKYLLVTDKLEYLKSI